MVLVQPRTIKRLVRPLRLCAGDTISIIAPASPPIDPGVIARAKSAFEERGFKVELGKHIAEKVGFLAGSDTQRLRDLNTAIRSKKSRAIISIRGGYGMGRLLHGVDFAALRATPKIVVGCSDITSLLCGALVESNIPTLHGPLPQSLCESDCPVFTWSRLIETMQGAESSLGSILTGYPETSATVRPLRKGRVTAQLVGGNLSIVASLIGTPFMPSLKGKIFFFEDIGVTPFRLDRLLTQMISIGAFDGVAGFALGQCINCAYSPNDHERKQSATDVFIERLVPLGKPIVMGLPFGHGRYNATIALGVKATLDGGRADLIIEEAAVRQR